MLKVTNRQYSFNVEILVKVGDLVANMSYQIFVGERGKKLVFDKDRCDITDIEYMGVKIEGYGNWTKFSNFHKEMGINYTEALWEAADKVVTDKEIQKVVNTIKL